MNDYIQRLNKLFKREIKRIIERPTIHLIAIVLPQVLFLYFVWIYTQGNVRHIPLMIYDADRSELSRILIRSFEASGTFCIVDVANTEIEIAEAFRKGKIQAALVIPRFTEHDLKRGKSATIVVYSNATNLLIDNTALKEASSIVKTVSTGITIKKLRMTGMSEEQAQRGAFPVRVDSRPLYNSYYNYAQYIGTGLLPAIFQILIMMVAVLLISSEFTHNTFHELFSLAQGNIILIILTKTLPYFVLHMITVFGLVGIIFPIFHIPIVGSYWLLFLLFFFFIAASHCMGLVLSAIFHNQQLATEIAFFINIPAFVFSGYIFPLWAMPSLHKIFASLLPFTHFLYSYLQIQAMGLGFVESLDSMKVLILFWFASTIVLYAILKWSVREQLQHKEFF